MEKHLFVELMDVDAKLSTLSISNSVLNYPAGPSVTFANPEGPESSQNTIPFNEQSTSKINAGKDVHLFRFEKSRSLQKKFKPDFDKVNCNIYKTETHRVQMRMIPTNLQTILEDPKEKNTQKLKHNFVIKSYSADKSNLKKTNLKAKKISVYRNFLQNSKKVTFIDLMKKLNDMGYDSE